ncbi:MAG: para-aminobenzoate synthetase component 1 [Paraglaciecola sp.]|jgi:para-aminobenzoate synthetase component 1
MNNPVSSELTITPLSLPAHYDMATLFSHYASQDWAMLLDSANSQHQDGRFDLMVATPAATIITTGDTSAIWYRLDDRRLNSRVDPLVLLQQLVDEYIPQPNCDKNAPGAEFLHLPFKAGAMGYLGYDLGRRFETFPDLADAHLRAPDMAFGIYTWSVIKDNQNGMFYYCSVDSTTGPGAEAINALAHSTPSLGDFALLGPWQANMSQTEYMQKLQCISDYLRAGDCYQVNLAQRFAAHYTGDEYQAYLRLRSANQAPFSAFLRIKDNVILSISPERFLAVNGDKVQSKPIKGTRPRSADPVCDQANIDALLASEKDQAENLMIVDLLRNDLSKSCQPDSVDVPQLFQIESFAAVHHLVSTVTGTLAQNCTPIDLLRGAFPGGSITGAPKIRAMEIIEELEPHRRNIYCGSIGYLGVNRDMDSSICIRTLLCEDNNIYCWAGGGIVMDSVAHEEYQESLDKVCKILPILSQ